MKTVPHRAAIALTSLLVVSLAQAQEEHRGVNLYSVSPHPIAAAAVLKHVQDVDHKQ